MTRSAPPRQVLTLGVLIAALFVSVPAFAARYEAVDRTAPEGDARTTAALEWIAAMDAHYDANPHLKTMKGHGFNPFNRIKWHVEKSLHNGRLPAPDARYKAWQEKQQRETQLTARNHWFTIGPTNRAGRIISMDFDPNDASIIYVGSAAGGVWKSTDSGITWTPKSDHLLSLGVGGVAVSKTNSNVVVMGTGESSGGVGQVGSLGIFRSTDAGETWEQTDMAPYANAGNSEGFFVVTAGPNGTFLAGHTDGLWRSSDDGATWTKVRASGGWSDVVYKPGTTDTVFAAKAIDATGKNVKISTDDGLTWTKSGLGQPQSSTVGNQIKIAISRNNPETMYAAYADNGFGTNTLAGIYRSTDGGANWTLQNSNPNEFGGQLWYNMALACDPNDPDVVVGGGQALRRSTNGAVSFVNGGSGVHVDHHVAKYEPGSDDNLWLGNDGGMYTSSSDGAPGTWNYRSEGLVTYQFYDICVNNGPTSYYVLGGTQDNGTDRWAGTGTSWTIPSGSGGDGMVCNVSPADGTTVYSEAQFGAHRKSTNSGNNFSGFTNGLTGSGAWVAPRDVGPINPSRAWTSTSAGIFRSNASQWIQMATHSAGWISVSQVDGAVVWTGTWLTTDSGSTWDQKVFGVPTGTMNKIYAHPTEVASAFAVFGGYSNATPKVMLTTDYGSTWTDVSGDFPAEPCQSIVVNPSNTDQWFVGTDLGVYYSEDGGATWHNFHVGLPNTVVFDLEIRTDLQKLVAGTFGRGAWETDIPAIGVVTAPEVTPERRMMLDAPMPNPVSDRTMLRFAAKSSGPVTLDVFDVTGRLVTRVAESPTGDGVVRTAPWFADGRPAGVYFAVLQAGAEKMTQKIVVTK